MSEIELLGTLEGVLPAESGQLRMLDSGWVRIRTELELPDGHPIDVYVEAYGEQFRIFDGGSATLALECGDAGEVTARMRRRIENIADVSGIAVDGLDLFVDVVGVDDLVDAVARMSRTVYEIARMGASAETAEFVASD